LQYISSSHSSETLPKDGSKSQQSQETVKRNLPQTKARIIFTSGRKKTKTRYQHLPCLQTNAHISAYGTKDGRDNPHNRQKDKP